VELEYIHTSIKNNHHNSYEVQTANTSLQFTCPPFTANSWYGWEHWPLTSTNTFRWVTEVMPHCITFIYGSHVL